MCVEVLINSIRVRARKEAPEPPPPILFSVADPSLSLFPPLNLTLLVRLFWLLIVVLFAFDLFVTVIKHVRGHPSGPKISRSHPDVS